jgi:hypothetical protein
MKTLNLKHAGGSSRPCEIVSIDSKATRRGRGATIRVRWGMAGVYSVNPYTGSTDLAGWTADPAECQRVLAEEKK